MQILHERCCGLDVHKNHVNACLITPGSGRTRTKEQRRFGTMTHELLALLDWLLAAGCTHVVMESTGSYWKPVYNILEDTLELILANPQHVKGLPGRKTDVGDAEWLADLLQHGLVRPSFIPPRSHRELRELTRYRKSLIQQRSTTINRIQKVLEGGNIKLASVATNIAGRSGRAMIEALIAGETDVTVMAELAKGRMRTKLVALHHALHGVMGPHQRFLLAQQLAALNAVDAAIDACSSEIATRMAGWQDQFARICTIPGIGPRLAEVILAEIGVDMSQFPTHQQLASWAGMCPGSHESGGKRLSGKTRKGSKWLREALVEAAHAAARARTTYLGAQYQRLAARRGGNKAAVAVGHTILVIIYHLIRDGGTYTDLGPRYFDQRDQERVQRRLVRRLESLGYTVQVTAPTASVPA
jgi:transposase